MRFDFDLNVNAAALPIMALVALSGASVGYAFAMLLKPQVAQQLTSFIAIGILLFSPINFPAERMPDVMQAIHRVLPVQYMADLIRWSLTGVIESGISTALGMVVAWCLAGIVLRVAVRRI